MRNKAFLRCEFFNNKESEGGNKESEGGRFPAFLNILELEGGHFPIGI